MKNAAKSFRHIPQTVMVVASFVACATPARYAESRPLRDSGGGYDVNVLVDGAPAPTFWHAGETYVMGRVGERYVIRVSNHTGRRIEAVVTVDGRDVVDGKPGDFRNKRGYLVPAWGQVDIDGWRLSQAQAAAFRFSSVADSYAARMGNAREVGVIGVAVFPERVWRPRPVYVPPPCCVDRYDDDLGYRDRPLRRQAERGPGPGRGGPGGAHGAQLGRRGQGQGGGRILGRLSGRAAAIPTGTWHRVRRVGHLAHPRGPIRARQLHHARGGLGSALQRPRRPAGHGRERRRPLSLAR